MQSDRRFQIPAIGVQRETLLLLSVVRGNTNAIVVGVVRSVNLDGDQGCPNILYISGYPTRILWEWLCVFILLLSSSSSSDIFIRTSSCTVVIIYWIRIVVLVVAIRYRSSLLVIVSIGHLLEGRKYNTTIIVIFASMSCRHHVFVFNSVRRLGFTLEACQKFQSVCQDNTACS